MSSAIEKSVSSELNGPSTFNPGAVFSKESGEDRNVPRALIAPPRYIQGPNVIDHLGRYLSLVPSQFPAIVISSGGKKRFQERITKSLDQEGVTGHFTIFDGECSDEEVVSISNDLLNSGVSKIDSIVVVGGGKCVDAGKCVAHRLGVPVVVCPTIASNDAPCSAVSVVYTPEGAFKRPEMFTDSPAAVIVDTQIIANAPVRHFVAGIGDAMATWYEARSSKKNPAARTHIGARPTATAIALSEFCAQQLFALGVEASEDVRNKRVSEAVEVVVEANTLLSGLGFESGGLGVAHGVASGLTVIPEVDEQYLHGEMVAIGTLSHLATEENWAEVEKIANFFIDVGLPVHLGQLSIDPEQDAGKLETVFDAVMHFPFISNADSEISKDKIKKAVLRVHELGLAYTQEKGEQAYKSMHG